MKSRKRKTSPGKGGGGFGNGLKSKRKSAHSGTPSQAFCDNFAAAVLNIGGEVHRVPDGKGGIFQVSIINPGAIRPANCEGAN